MCYVTTRLTLDIAAIGRRAFTRREELHLDQEQVADLAGMSRAYVSRLENGGVRNLKVADLAAIADALRLSLDHLIYGRDAESTDADMPRLLIRRLGPDLGSAVARFDMALANLERGDIDAAIVVLDSITERRMHQEG